MATLRTRYNKFEAKVYVPNEARGFESGRGFVYKTLTSRDRKMAKVEAEAWESSLKIKWYGMVAPADAPKTALRQVYERTRAEAERGEYKVYVGDEDPHLAGIAFEIDRIADEVGDNNEPTPSQSVMLAALQHAAASYHGKRPKPPRSLELTFSETAAERMTAWRRDASLKEANTGNQREAVYRLFASYSKDRPIRDVEKVDASRFYDALKSLNPHWARAPEARRMAWDALQKTYGNHATGLSDATMNRHVRYLADLWSWAEERDLCEGRNPFKGFAKKVKAGRNQHPYLAWREDELKRLLASPPKRQDLRELIVVGMYTGMRIDEIASLTRGQIREDSGIFYVQVDASKTPAGQRKVPLHPKLAWLAQRGQADNSEPVWPNFNGEGPAKKRGADAGKEFSRFKLAKGFNERTKAFHSFRKNVTGQMENLQVPENEWGQLIGHEYGFTYTTYNPDGISLKRKAEIMALIDYPKLDLSAYLPAECPS